MKSGLEVFDFKEGDELPDYAAEKFLSKFKNPSIGNPAILKPELLERASQGAVSVEMERRTDASEGDNPPNSSKSGTAPSSLETDREHFATQDTTAGPGASWQSQSPTHDNNFPCSKIDKFKSEGSFTVETRLSCDEAPSPGKCQSTCALAASPSNSEPVNEKSDADGMSSPSSSISNIVVNDGIVDGRSSNNVVSAPEMVAINIAVDYVLYHHNYCTGCKVQFSSDGIKISGFPAYGEQEFFCFEKGIDDIIRIESQQLRRSGNVSVKLHFLPKDDAQEVVTDGIELLEFALVEPNWSGKFEEITSLDNKYLAVSSILWDTDFSMDGGADILQQRSYFPKFDEAIEDVVYPKGDSDAVSISKRDFDLLQPETFVNDTIIDFYIKYLKNQIPPEERHRFHFFNSFFFRKLADLDKDPSSVSDGRAAFLRVHKWTRKVDIFGKDYIFIPVNFSLHWSLLVLCHPGEVAGFQDADLGKSLRVPCILHMDSIKGTHAGLKNLVQSYLREEWKSRHIDTSDDLSTRFLNMRFVPLELPQQENSFDCGLFLLHYLELFLADAPLDFSPFKINKASEFLTVDWFPPAEASLKRTLIQRLISGLVNNQTRELSSADCHDEPELSCFPQNNLKESAVRLVSERYPSAVACHGEASCSDANQGIEITLLQSSMRNVDCVSDSGLVLRELFEPGVAEGSLIAQCSSFDEPSYYRHDGAMSQQIKDDDGNEAFVCFTSANSVLQQVGDMAPQSGSLPSWKQGENDAFTPETSASDDSDVGIIENCSIQEDQDLFQRDGVDKQASQSTEKMDFIEDLSLGNENFSFSQEDVANNIHRGSKMLENGLRQQSEAVINSDKVQTVGSDFPAEPNEVMLESDEKQTAAGHKVMAESDEKQSNDSNLGAEQSNNSNVVPEPDETNTKTESDENQLNDSNTIRASDEKQTVEVNLVVELDKKRESDEMETIESDEQHQATKRRRVEGEDSTRNMSEDLHL